MSTEYISKINQKKILAERASYTEDGVNLDSKFTTLDTAVSDKEDASNKAQTIIDSSTTDFPSSKAVADFVNSSVATNTANFLGTYDSYLDLGISGTDPSNTALATALDNFQGWPAGTTITNNDYVFVSVTKSDPNDAGEYRRFKYNAETETWGYEYTLNNSSYTTAQWAAIISGIDSTKVSKIGQIDGKADKVSNAVSGNFAGLDANGNLVDSSYDASDFAPATHTHGNMANDGTDGQNPHDTTKFLRADGTWAKPPTTTSVNSSSSQCYGIFLGSMHDNINSQSFILVFDVCITILGKEPPVEERFNVNISVRNNKFGGYIRKVRPKTGKDSIAELNPVIKFVQNSNYNYDIYLLLSPAGDYSEDYVYYDFVFYRKTGSSRYTEYLTLLTSAFSLTADATFTCIGDVYTESVGTAVGSPTTPVYVTSSGGISPCSGFVTKGTVKTGDFTATSEIQEDTIIVYCGTTFTVDIKYLTIDKPYKIYLWPLSTSVNTGDFVITANDYPSSASAKFYRPYSSSYTPIYNGHPYTSQLAFNKYSPIILLKTSEYTVYAALY